MPCDSKLKRNQTIQQRAEEVKKAVSAFDALIASRSISVRVGPQGAIAFTVPESMRDGITDACIYRRIMAIGSVLAKAQIARAEAMAGVKINKQAVGQGVHSHDGGRTWHEKG